MDTNQTKAVGAIPLTPCESFDAWASLSDTRIASAGLRLRIKWCETALSIPVLVPLVGYVMRGVRENWPDPNTARTTLANLAQIATYIHELEAKAAGKGVAE